MIRDRRMVGDQAVADPGADPFIDIEPKSHRPAPFQSPPFDAVHVDQDLLSGRPQAGQQRRGVVAKHQAHAILRGGVAHRMPVEFDGPGRAPASNPHMHALDAAPGVGRKPPHGGFTLVLAIDGDAPIALHQEDGKPFGKSLETAVASRDATGPEHEHTRSIARHGSGPNRRTLRPTAGRITCAAEWVAKSVPPAARSPRFFGLKLTMRFQVSNVNEDPTFVLPAATIREP